MIRLRAAGYRYPAGVGVGPVDLDVAAGELVLLTGPTGCGKSTLLRLAAGLLQRHGHGVASGEVRVAGVDPGALVAAERVGTLGFVGQDPDDQVMTGSVAAEIAFGPESAGGTPADIDARVAWAVEEVGLTGLEARAPMALSGGQRQRLVIAASLSGGARVLLLDEPLSQLDPDGAASVMRTLRRLADEGVAVLMVEHRLEQAMALCDRVVVMAEGRIVADPLVGLAPLHALGLRGPALRELAARAGMSPPVTVPIPVKPPGETVIRLTRLTAGYEPKRPVIHDISLTVPAGERIAVLGANGAGKSTLLAALDSLRPEAGERDVRGRVVRVPQNPDLALFCATVREELAYAPEELGLDRALVDRCAATLSVTPLLDRPPQALSRGQRLRVAVAAALAAAPAVLLLDEPTSGQDHDQVERMFDGLREALGDGVLVFATHDVELALRHATRIVVIEAGRVHADVPPVPRSLAAAVTGTAVHLPPLAALCAAEGLPFGTLDEIAALRGAP